MYHQTSDKTSDARLVQNSTVLVGREWVTLAEQGGMSDEGQIDFGHHVVVGYVAKNKDKMAPVELY